MSTSLFLETLRRAELDHFYPNFATKGINNLEGLAQLTMQDYSSLGVTSMDDRKRLFQLIQMIKSTYPGIGDPSISENTPPYSSMTQKALPTPATSIAPATSIPRPPSVIQTHPPIPSTSVAPLRQESRYEKPLALKQDFSENYRQDSLPVEYRYNDVQTKSTVEQSGRQVFQGSTETVRPISRSEISSVSVKQLPVPRTNERTHVSVQLESQMDLLQMGSKPESVPFEDDLDIDADMDSDSPPKVKAVNNLNAYGVPKTTAKRNASPSRQISKSSLDMTERIRVCVRKRPLSKKEIKRNEIDIALVGGRRTITINEPKVKVDLTKYIEQHTFFFDEVFDSDASNEDVYRRTALPLVEYIFGGGKATCFAYGQTGSGKTHTMLDEHQGLYVLAARDMFKLLQQPQYQHLSAYVSFYEIYQGHLYDLLNNRKRLFAREDGNQNVCKFLNRVII